MAHPNTIRDVVTAGLGWNDSVGYLLTRGYGAFGVPSYNLVKSAAPPSATNTFSTTFGDSQGAFAGGPGHLAELHGDIERQQYLAAVRHDDDDVLLLL